MKYPEEKKQNKRQIATKKHKQINKQENRKTELKHITIATTNTQTYIQSQASYSL